MGKGNRNRINREAEPKVVQKPKKVRRYRKPLSGTAKGIIAGAVCFVLIVAIVFGTLASNGTFKRGNILIKSKTGEFDINQQMATYMVWDALYYTAYYQWNYLSSTIQQTYGSSMNQSTWCLQSAASGVQDTLKTSINSYEKTLKEYVAICDIAQSTFGITLTKEEKKAAREEAVQQITYMASLSQLNDVGFINLYIGNSVKMKDIEAVAEIQALYAKIVEKKQGEIEASVTEEILKTYRDENPESFYSTDYLLYSTKDAAMKDLLVAATSVNAFKTVLVKDVFENGDNTFKASFNKNLTAHSQDAQTVLTAIEKKATIEELNTALAAQSMTAQEYVKEGSTLNETLIKWMFDSARKQLDAASFVTADSIYVVALTSAPADGKVNAAIKEITLDSGESYGEDTAFKTNIYNTLLNELELLDSTEGLTLYSETEDEKIQKVIDELTTAAEKVIPADKTENYTKEPKEGSYQEWMFKNESAPLTSPVAAGAVKDFSETKDEVTTYSIYCIVDPMKLDYTPLVNGGYLEFTGDGHADKAQEFLNSLSGLAGDALAEKFTAQQKAVVSETVSESNIAITELSDWIFSDTRKADDVALIAVADKTPNDDKTTESCSYVAFYRDSTPTWENSADNGYVNESLQAWVDGLIADYTLDGMNRIKDQNPVETTAATTTAAAEVQ